MAPYAGSTRLGIVLLAGVTLAWGVNWVFMKVSLLEIPLWQYRAVLVVVAGASTLALAGLAGIPLMVPRRDRVALVWAALFNVTLWHVLTAYAILEMATGQASLIAFTMPVWAAIIGVLVLNERLGARPVVALALGMGGIAVLLSHDAASLGAGPLGTVYALLAAIAWAAGTVIYARVHWTAPTLTLVGWQLLLGAVPLAVIAIAVEPVTIHRASATALGAMAFTALVAIVFAYYAWFRVVKIFPAAIASIGTLLTPVVALISGALVFAEPLGWRETLACVLIVSALALVLIRRAPVAAAAEPAE